MAINHLIIVLIILSASIKAAGVQFDMMPCKLHEKAYMQSEHDRPAVGYWIPGKLNTAFVEYLVAYG